MHNIQPLHFIKTTHVPEFRVLIRKRFLHAHIADIAQMAIQHRTDHDLALLENECFHRIVWEVDAQVCGVIALKFQKISREERTGQHKRTNFSK